MSIVFVVSWLISIVLTFVIAQKNARNEGLAVIMGILFGWLAVIGYLIAGKSFEKKLEEAKQLGQI